MTPSHSTSPSLRRVIASWAITCGVCLAPIVIASGRWPFRRTTQAGTSGPASPLVVAPADLDFGERFQGTEFDWTVSLQNATGQAVAISELRASCDCAAVQPTSAVVAPRSTLPVRLHMRVPIREAPGTDAHEHAVRLTAIMNKDDDRRDVVWIIHGRATRPVELSAGQVDWGDNLSPTGQGVHSKLIAKLLSTQVADVRIQPSEHVDVRLTRGPRVYELDISPRGPLGPGPISDKINLDLVAPDDRVIGTITIPVVGTVLDDLTARPHTIYLGGTLIGREVTEIVHIASRRAASITAVNLEAGQHPDLTVKVRWLGNGNVELRLTPMAIGNKATYAGLVVTSRGDKHALRIPVIYYGITDRR
jgi:hypothetical protein